MHVSPPAAFWQIILLRVGPSFAFSVSSLMTCFTKWDILYTLRTGFYQRVVHHPPPQLERPILRLISVNRGSERNAASTCNTCQPIRMIGLPFPSALLRS